MTEKQIAILLMNMQEQLSIVQNAVGDIRALLRVMAEHFDGNAADEFKKSLKEKAV